MKAVITYQYKQLSCEEGEIVYTPPPPESVPVMTRNLIEWLNSGIDIQDAEVLCSGVNRRTLQRDLAEFIDMDIITKEDSTNQRSKPYLDGVEGILVIC
jgi:hypothetical protein